ncbi:MarR family transcriptional regulator [Streptomyces sulphureus]|uniref:MarR family transcriptional regulator n=1 Tax=Streptomyces sulphureus TaxID=47758 RepID=UPI00037DD4B9
MQAIGHSGSIADVGHRLGVSKQAAHRTVEKPEEPRYARRQPSPVDRRRTVVVLIERGREALVLSGQALDRIGDEWAAEVGEQETAALGSALEAVVRRTKWAVSPGG